MSAQTDFLKWWVSIETDSRKALIFGAIKDPQKLHALLRMAYEAGQAAKGAA